MEYYKTVITQLYRPQADYAYITFEPERSIGGAPGQFVMVRGTFGTDPILPRAFSLVAAGEQGAILVKTVGKATHRLAEMHPGDTLMVLGPLGNTFSMPDDRTTPLLAAGGVGVAPLIFMAEQLASRGRRPIFVYGGRTRQDLLFESRIRASAELMTTTEDGSMGRKGRVTDLIPELLEAYPNIAVFSCGPEPMLKALHDALPSNVSLEVALEQAMACGMGTCKGCAVRDHRGGYKYVCSDGPVFDSAEIFGGKA